MKIIFALGKRTKKRSQNNSPGFVALNLMAVHPLSGTATVFSNGGSTNIGRRVLIIVIIFESPSHHVEVVAMQVNGMVQCCQKVGPLECEKIFISYLQQTNKKSGINKIQR